MYLTKYEKQDFIYVQISHILKKLKYPREINIYSYKIKFSGL